MSSKNTWIIVFIILILAIGLILFKSKIKNAVMPTPSPQAAAITPENIPSPSPEVMKKEVIVNLDADKSSSESGTAKLTEVDGKVTVTLDLSNGPIDTPQPAHIHTGKCPDVGAIKYPLTNVINGKSETKLDVSLDTIMSELPLGINVHKSTPQIKTYVACGDLKAQ